MTSAEESKDLTSKDHEFKILSSFLKKSHAENPGGDTFGTYRFEGSGRGVEGRPGDHHIIDKQELSIWEGFLHSKGIILFFRCSS